jgi:hypothetical protein
MVYWLLSDDTGKAGNQYSISATKVMNLDSQGPLSLDLECISVLDDTICREITLKFDGYPYHSARSNS